MLIGDTLDYPKRNTFIIVINQGLESFLKLFTLFILTILVNSITNVTFINYIFNVSELFLGFIASARTSISTPTSVQAIRDWPMEKLVKGQCFFNLAIFTVIISFTIHFHCNETLTSKEEDSIAE